MVDKRQITERLIKSIKTTGRDSLYYDKEVQGFAVRLARGKLTYIAIARIKGGNTKKVTIAPCSQLSPKEARLRASKLLIKLREGIAPN